jgi:hypothetical protein
MPAQKILSSEYNCEFAATAAGAVTLPVPGRPGYFVNAAGQFFSTRSRIRRDRQSRKPAAIRPLVLWRGQGGQFYVSLSTEYGREAAAASRIVAAAFLPPAEGKLLVSLVDTSRPDDHSLPNLVWKSSLDLEASRVAGVSAALRKLTPEQVAAARVECRTTPLFDVAERLGVHVATLRSAVLGRSYPEADRMVPPLASGEIMRLAARGGRKAMPLPAIDEVRRLGQAGWTVRESLDKLGLPADDKTVAAYRRRLLATRAESPATGVADEVRAEDLRRPGDADAPPAEAVPEA